MRWEGQSGTVGDSLLGKCQCPFLLQSLLWLPGCCGMQQQLLDYRRSHGQVVLDWTAHQSCLNCFDFDKEAKKTKHIFTNFANSLPSVKQTNFLRHL